jgi:hypothetical protein
MQTWTLRLGLSLIVVVGYWTHRLPAQEILIVPEIRYEPAHHAPAPFPFAPRPVSAPADHFGQRCLNKHGVGCKDDPYAPACSSLHYELRFMFGSCRSFFEQPCAPARPFKHTPR